MKTIFRSEAELDAYLSDWIERKYGFALHIFFLATIASVVTRTNQPPLVTVKRTEDTVASPHQGILIPSVVPAVGDPVLCMENGRNRFIVLRRLNTT